jgi:hypothetical protein
MYAMRLLACSVTTFIMRVSRILFFLSKVLFCATPFLSDPESFLQTASPTVLASPASQAIACVDDC